MTERSHHHDLPARIIRPSSRPLTERQAEILDYIGAYVADHGYPPTFRELSSACGMGSPSGASRMLQALERKGYLTRTSGLSRGLTLVSPQVDFSAIDSDDLVWLAAASRVQGTARDAEFSRAARHGDAGIKETLARHALERHRYVTSLDDMARELVSGEIRECMEPIKAFLDPSDWPAFVVGYLIWNRTMGSFADYVSERGPMFRTIVWENRRLLRKAEADAERWMGELLAGGADLRELRKHGLRFGELLYHVGETVNRMCHNGDLNEVPARVIPTADTVTRVLVA